MAAGAQAGDGTRGGGRLRRFLARRGRTWVLMVPLHLVAFAALYFATVRLLETQIGDLARESAAERLELASRELYEVALAHSGDRRRGHPFAALLATHRGINMQLFLSGGSFVGPAVALSERDHREISEFFRGSEVRQVWLSDLEGRRRMHGLRRIAAVPDCAPCHPPGETLAVASMSLDLTRILDRTRSKSRRNLALLILAWAAALVGTTAIVRLSVERSAARLRADLAAVEAGEGGAAGRDTDVVLDPAAAHLHRSLRDFLARQRQRHEEVASRLAHTDQLASLGQMAAGLAHEIKNPLAGIQGALEILREDEPEEPTGRLYDEMLAELGRVNQTLQTLLSSARPSPPRLAITDLRELAGDVERLLEPGLRRRGIALELELAEGPLTARVDAGKIRQVLVNLVQNAGEALESGGRITLRAAGFPDGGVALAVEDDGPGIPEDQRRRIFEPFFTTKFGGTGLGLAISRSLVEQHGGRLEVKSEPGRGSTFYLLLPGSDQAAAPAAADAPPREA